MQQKIGLPSTVSEALSGTDFSFTRELAVPEIGKLLSQSCLNGGKRFRPALCFLMSGVVGFPLDNAKLYARASELVHSASLTHDDVIDFAHKRRGHPTLNALTDNKRAVLGGDLLLARVMTELIPTAPRIVILELAQAIEELVQGEWLQAEAVGISAISQAHLETVSRLKTASLIRWCCTAPAHSLAESNPSLVQSCRAFGEFVGLAFQMVDDVVDFEDASGKEYAKDLSEGLINWVSLEMMNRNIRIQSALKDLPVERWKDVFLNAAGLSEAKAIVRARAHLSLDSAKSTLQWLASLSASSISENQQIFIQSLSGALNSIGERKC